MIRPVHFYIMIIFCTFFVGCVALQKKKVISAGEDKTRLTKLYYEKALDSEKQNEFIESKKNYELAITADPLNKTAQQGLLKNNKKLLALADQHYEESIKLYKKGKYNESKRYLLIALRLWPDHKTARLDLIERQDLKTRQDLNIQNYISYEIKKGDSLSKISKRFYGNFKQSYTIARINNIGDAGKIRPGVKLKIPELKEHPFIRQHKIIKLKKIIDIPVPPEIKADSKGMYQNLGMEFFNEGQFKSAISEFKKVLSSDSRDKSSTSYMSKSYYQMGLKQNADKNYIAAIDHFKDALRFDNDCLLCKKQIKTCRNTYLENHYKTGMKFFNKQNLEMAVFEWNLVQKMDQNYKKVTELLNKTKTIQKNIDVLKKSEK